MIWIGLLTTAHEGVWKVWSSAASNGVISVGGGECGDGQERHGSGIPLSEPLYKLIQSQPTAYTWTSSDHDLH